MKLIIKKPIITEKCFALSSTGVYIFHVDQNANKHSVAEEVHKLFKVDVLHVNMVKIPGKVKRVGKKFGKRSDIKKAYVKIKKGQTISIFDAEENKKEVKSSSSEKKPKIEKSVKKVNKKDSEKNAN